MFIEHKRKSLRLKGYDYSSPGAYFVTICTQNKENKFGAIVNGVMQLNEFGTIVQESWLWLSKQYEYVELDEWVIMPNHFHGIIMITEFGRGGSRIAPTSEHFPVICAENHIKSLGGLVGAFKTVAAKRINELRNMPGGIIWQRNYYEHVIRNENDLYRVREYIVSNALKWEDDEYYKSVVREFGRGGSRTAPT
ncbi:MAG: transposase [Smithellaceae bacterium]